jgi:hypothetical protein
MVGRHGDDDGHLPLRCAQPLQHGTGPPDEGEVVAHDDHTTAVGARRRDQSVDDPLETDDVVG